MPIAIGDQVVDFYNMLFERIFSQAFLPQIENRLKRNTIKRQVEEAADAASQSLARFFLNQQLTPQQAANVLAGFAALHDLLKLNDIANPNVTPESVVEELLLQLPSPPAVQQDNQAAIYRVCLHSIIQVLMLAGPVMAEWQKLNFSSTFELPRRVVNRLNQISEHLNALGSSGPAAADERYELTYRDYLLQRFHRVEAGTVRMTTNMDVDLRELFVMPKVLPRPQLQEAGAAKIFDPATLMDLAAARKFFASYKMAAESEDKTEKEKPGLRAIEQIKNHTRLVMVGTPGSGKSNQRFQLNQTKKWDQNENKVGIMGIDAKISPAFEPFLAESGPNDRREAIVIYRAPEASSERVRGRLRTLKQRLKAVEVQATAQRPVQVKLLQSYQREGVKLLSRKEELAVFPIGEKSALPVATVEVTPKTLPALAEQPQVVAVLPNQRIQLIKPREIDYAELAKKEIKDKMTWGLQQFNISEVWKKTKGKDINVAVLDTGVHAEHPALKGRVKEFVIVDPLGRRIMANPAFDGGRHGTHVCGTIAGGKTPNGVAIGIAPEASLLVAAVLLGEATLHTLVEGISWAVEKGADLISMSLGFAYYEPLFAEVFKILIENYGILPVVAIGNENHGNSSSPGNAYNAFSVGAVEKMARGKLDIAFFSSGASMVFPGAEPNALVTKPDVVAPGVQVYSCIPPAKTPYGIYEYTYMDGTSMAAPHVAGVAALLMAANPEAQVADIIEALKKTAKHPQGEPRRPDNRWGYGIIRPLEALKALN